MPSAEYSPAHSIWENRAQVEKDLPRLTALWNAVGYLNDLTPAQWVQWYSTALAFQPDLIIELGRNQGNSTCLFTQAANTLQHGKLVSLCLTDYWQQSVAQRVSQVVPSSWFDRLDPRVADIIRTTPSDLVGDAKRILVIWDAHGFRVAEWVLGALAPHLEGRQSLILMHDIADTRYSDWDGSYNGQRLWQGRHTNEGAHARRLAIGNAVSPVEQMLSAIDFTTRNKISFQSADHSYATELTESQVSELSKQLDGAFDIQAGWHYFSLQDAKRHPLTFPGFSVEERDLSYDYLYERVHDLQHQVDAMLSSSTWRYGSKAAKLLHKLLGKRPASS